MKELGLAAMILCLLVFVFCIGPMLILWAANTLFEQAGAATQIPHNFWTYLAVLVLGGLFTGSSKATK